VKSPEICVLKTDGTNCDAEMQNAFEIAGAKAEIVHINDVRSGAKKLADYAGLGLPGGFSYGDDIASGAVLANELEAYLGEELHEFVESEKPMLGICNGFQVMARSGILPNRDVGNQTVTLSHNLTGQFICRWVDLEVENSACQFTSPDDFSEEIPMQIAHAEGRFLAGSDGLESLRDNRQITFTYADNPNGSDGSIAGICDQSGLVLGMMPHPERSIDSFHPDRAKTEQARTVARTLFKNFVGFAGEM
jgi:phosphoribosylformylglycinamidine synthase subunit PurQ / glutaminase